MCLLVIIGASATIRAQLYPVTAQISPTGLPLDPYVHQWIDPADMISPMQITLVLNDLNAGSLSVGIRATIQGQGVEIQSDPNVPFIMDLAPGAIVTFDQQMLGRLFSLQSLLGMTPVGGEFALPEGLYTICIEAYVLNRDVVVSNPACAVFHVQRFDVPEWLMLQPAVVLPDDEFTLGQVASETAQSLTFSWSNRHPEILMAEYQLQMWEVRPEFSALTYDQLVHSTLPFFDQTVFGTQYLYSALDPPLKSDQTYLARLTVRDPTGTYQFVHNGVGPVASFRIVGGEEGPESIPCLDPRNKPVLTAEEVTDDLLQLYWTVPDYLDPESFYLYGRYENGTGDWELIDRVEGNLRSFDLAWGIDAPVAVRVGFACDLESSLVYSDPWSFVPFPDLLPDGCDVTLEFEIDNEDILPMDLIPGDSVIVGDYVLVFDEISGDRYGYFGLGYVTTPLFGLFEPQVNVAFQNLVVNTDFQMIGGSVQTIKYEDDATILDLSPLRDLLNQVSDELTYTSHIIDDSIGGIRINTDGETEILTIDSAGQVVVITFPANLEPPPDNAHAFRRNGYQSAGDVFLDQMTAGATTFEGPNGEIFIRVGESTHEESDLLESEHMNEMGDLGAAIFSRHPNAPGGFDLPFSEAGATDYDSIGSYAMPWKAIRLGTSEPVDVDLADVSAEEIRFETFTGYSLHYPEPAGDKVTLQIPSRTDGDGDAVYALGSNDGGENFQTLGGVKIAGYSLAVRTLNVIAINGAEVPVTEEELATALNKIYNPAIATWQVRFLDPVDGIEFDRDGDGAAAVGLRTGGGVDQEIRDIARALKDQIDKGTKDDPIFTIVVVPRLEHDYNGYMPRGRELGFVEPIDGNAINGIHPFSRLVAHELGHGAFGLLHTWEEYPDLVQGQTDDLMDYGDGVDLHKRQWDHIHDPPTILNFLETTEGGGGIGNPTRFCISDPGLLPENRTFITPDGKAVLLDQGEVPVSFYAVDDENSSIRGTLNSFTREGRSYVVQYANPGQVFIGFVDANENSSEKEIYEFHEGIDDLGQRILGRLADCQARVERDGIQVGAFISPNCNCNPDDQFLVNYSTQVIDRNRLVALLSGKETIDDEVAGIRHDLKAYVFITDHQTNQADIDKVESFQTPHGTIKIWININEEGAYHLQSSIPFEGEFNDYLSELGAEQFDVEGFAQQFTQVESFSEGLYELFDLLSKGIRTAKIPAYVWNCDDEEIYNQVYSKVYGLLTPALIPIRMLLATTLEELSGGELEVEDLTQVEFALFCGIWNGAIEVVASVPDMIKLLVGAFNEDKRAEFYSLLEGLKSYKRVDEDGKVVATGPIAAIIDALSEQFNLETPCFFAHNVSEIGIGIVVAFVSGGTTLGSSVIGRFAGTFVRVIKYFDDLAALPFTMLAKFTGSTCRFFYQQANQLLYEINETIFRASLIIDGRIQEVGLAVNSVIVKQDIIAQPDGSLILKVDGNPSLPPEGAPFAFTRSTKLIAEGIGISEALLLRFREAGIGDHVVKQLKDGFEPSTLDEIIPIFESSDLTKALNQKLADDFVKDIDNFGREIVGRPELVRAWDKVKHSLDAGISAKARDVPFLQKFDDMVQNNNLDLDANGLQAVLNAAAVKGQKWDFPENILDAVKRASDGNIPGLSVSHKKFPQSSSGSSYVLDNAKQFQRESSAGINDANLSFDLNGTSFDDVAHDGKLIDRKFGHSSSIFDRVDTDLEVVYNVTNQNRAQSLMEQAYRQVTAAGGDGAKIRWEISTQDGAGGISQLFNDPLNYNQFPGIQNIDVIHVAQQTIIK